MSRLLSRRASEWLLYGLCGLLVYGAVVSLLAQSLPITTQDGINALLLSRQEALAARLDTIEFLMKYGLVALFGNLVTQLVTLAQSRRLEK